MWSCGSLKPVKRFGHPHADVSIAKVITLLLSIFCIIERYSQVRVDILDGCSYLLLHFDMKPVGDRRQLQQTTKCIGQSETGRESDIKGKLFLIFVDQTPSTK